MDDLLSDLSEEQQRAVTHAGGPLLVVAGPGTGKTRTLTRRIAYLVRERGADPRTIVAITFTHRAAREMKERLDALLDEAQSARIFVGTFHALGLEQVRREAGALGFEKAPILYDEEDARTLLEEALKALGPGQGPKPADKVRAAIDLCINRGLAMTGQAGGYDLNEVYQRYTEMKQEEGAVDFNDCLVLPLKLLEGRSEGVSDTETIRHLFVDEYQDVNAVQVQWIQRLVKAAESFMAIGDPDQAIYSFRGSDVGNFLDFERTFPDATVLRLKANYRSTVQIVHASDGVIRQNRERFNDSKPFSDSEPAAVRNKGGVVLEHRTLATDRAEASFVAHRIEALTGGMGRYGLEGGPDLEDDREPIGFGEIAVLYRLNAQAPVLVQALEKAGIPFQQVGTKSKGVDSAMQMISAAAMMAVQPESRAALRRLRLFAHQKGERAQGKSKGAHDKGKPLPDDVLNRLVRIPLDEHLFLAAAKELIRVKPELSADLEEGAARLETRRADEGLEPAAFLARAPLIQREDRFQVRCERVTLSTLHAAKGLEFPVVFLTGLEKGIVPYLRDDEENRAAALEEERRLLYVGMTRAKSELYLSNSRNRFLFGKQLDGQPSPFLSDISEDLIRFVRQSTGPKKRKPKDDGQMKLF